MTIAPESRRAPQFGLTHRLVLAREVADLDQYALAEALDVSRGTISNYERGVSKPSKLQLNAWAVTCEVDPDWLKTGHTSDDPDGGGTLVHPPGLEPGTHWLRDAAVIPFKPRVSRGGSTGPKRRAA